MARTGAGQDVSESDGAGALHTADRGRSRTYDRAVNLGSGWAGAGPAAIPVLLGTCWDCRQAGGNQQGRGTQSRRSCPMGPDSDGFKMNRLEEGALGDPVLAGNLVFNLDGRRRHS